MGCTAVLQPRVTGIAHAPLLTIVMALSVSGVQAEQPKTASSVIAVGEITVGGDLTGDEAKPHVGKGLTEEIIGQITTQLKEGDFTWCPIKVVEWTRRDEVAKEQALQLSGVTDKTLAVKEAYIMAPDYLIGGSVDFDNGGAAWTVDLQNASGGTAAQSISGHSATPADVLKQASRIATEFLDKACPRPWNVTGGGPRMKVTGTVARLDEPFPLDGVFPGGTADFVYTPTSRDGGTVAYKLQGSGFTGSGSGSYTIAPGKNDTMVIHQTTKGCMDGIPNGCKTNSEVLTLTPLKN